MRTIIAGSRTIIDYESVKKILDEHWEEFNINTIVSGGARGVDSIAIQYGRENDIVLDIYMADWEQFGKSAGYIRNMKMGENADSLICFWDGVSRGTANMISIMKKMNKPVVVFVQEKIGNIIKFKRI